MPKIILEWTENGWYITVDAKHYVCEKEEDETFAGKRLNAVLNLIMEDKKVKFTKAITSREA